jgi:hypothetical protein
MQNKGTILQKGIEFQAGKYSGFEVIQGSTHIAQEQCSRKERVLALKLHKGTLIAREQSRKRF